MLFHPLLAVLLSAESAFALGIGDYIHAGLGSSSNAVSASSSNGGTTSGSSEFVEPCSIIANASSHGAQYYNATIAYRCLQSVPLNTTAAALQIDGVRFFMQFQSTLGYLIDPPVGFLYPPIDIMDALGRLALNLRHGEYQNEYAFQRDLQAIIASAHDGHFWYNTDINDIFTFQRDQGLYSISKDGVAAPEVYLQGDADNIGPDDFANGANISPIVKINGQDVEKYLSELAIMSGGAQDPDTNYNQLFSNSFAQYTSQSTYSGDHDEIIFKNGSSVNVAIVAWSPYDLSTLIDGQSFFTKFLQKYESGDYSGPPGLSPYGSPVQARDAPSPTTSIDPGITQSEVPFSALPIRPPTYGPLEPTVQTQDDVLNGYLPTIHQDLAVLQISSFEPKDTLEFSNLVREFLATANADSRTKLIIDLRQNPGGTIAVGYDLFAQLFPNILPYGAWNIRANEFIDHAGQLISEYYSPYTNTTAPDSLCESGDIDSPLNYHEQFTMDNTNYTSWDEYYGPYTSQDDAGDQFISLSRYNLNDKFTLGCAPISNYRNLTGITPQVFDAENIVLLTDGTCASTCAIFSEFMKTQAHVRLVAVGGRAQQGPMQAVGGVKGANDWGWLDVWQSLASAVELSGHLTDAASMTQAVDLAAGMAEAEPGVRQALRRSTVANAPSLNFRNNIRPNDRSLMPLQFVYEAADCRLFYTLATMQHSTLLWDEAYKAFWGPDGFSLCVPGSTADPSTDPNADGTNVPPASARNFFGATVLSPLPAGLQSRVQTSNHNADSSATNVSTAPTSTPSAKKSEAVLISGPALRTSMVGFAIAVAGMMIML